MQRFGPSSRLVTIGRVNVLMVFKSIRDLLSVPASTWAISVAALEVIQDHPAYIPQSVIWPLHPELAVMLGVPERATS